MLTATLLLATTDMARAETVEESELRAAAGNGNAGEVERLLAEGTDPNVPDPNGRTALHHAAEIAKARILNALLESGGDPDVQDRDGSTPLHLAAAFPYFEPDSQASIRVLLNHRADPDRTDTDGPRCIWWPGCISMPPASSTCSSRAPMPARPTAAAIPRSISLLTATASSVPMWSKRL